MNEDYKIMWDSLGLDLERHDALLSILSNYYRDIYLTQENRPEGMKYFDFVISEVHGLRIKELIEAKKNNRRIIGTFCVYVPEEMILAVDGVCIGLCAGAEVGYEEAERYLPRNLCPLIKSFVGFKLAKVCPYVETTDLIVGETTCDGKKKTYEIFNELTKKVYAMEVPNMKNSEDIQLWFEELKKFKIKLEEVSGKKLEPEKLKEAIEVVNNKRKALIRLKQLRTYNPPPISGLDALLVNQVAFYDDPIRFTNKVNELCDELEERVKKGIGVVPKGTVRILITGTPFAIPNWKLHYIIEKSGAIVVGEESCIGSRYFNNLVETNFNTIDEGLRNLMHRYMKTECACFTPNIERIESIKNYCSTHQVDGIIHYSLNFCTPYMIEAYKIEKYLDKPYIRIETDYSMEDFGQLKTRVEAFIEALK